MSAEPQHPPEQSPDDSRHFNARRCVGCGHLTRYGSVTIDLNEWQAQLDAYARQSIENGALADERAERIAVLEAQLERAGKWRLRR